MDISNLFDCNVDNDFNSLKEGQPMFDEETMERMEEEKLRIKGIERRLNGTDSSITGLIQRTNELEQGMNINTEGVWKNRQKANQLSSQLIKIEKLLKGLAENADIVKDNLKYLNDKLNIALATQNRMDKQLIKFETIKSRKEEEKSGK